ncbi:MAG: hypothetical protein ABSF26_27895 [Thermoguttaceae bacterium]|jgi:hypothetical protein
MHIVLHTHSSNPDYNGDCDYAVVELTPALLEQIRRRVELAREVRRQDDDLYELYFWGSNAQFYNHCLIEACEKAITATATGADADQAVRDWVTDLDCGEHAVLPPGVDLEVLESERTECNQAVIRCSPAGHTLQFEVAWTTIPKHSDVNVTTSELTLTALETYFRKHHEATE